MTGASADRVEPTSKWWLVPILLFAAMFAGWGVMISLALDDPGFAVEPEYYDKAIRWDTKMAQDRENVRLGWKADVSTVPGNTGEIVLRLSLRDRLARPVAHATVNVTTFHNARAAQPLDATLKEADEGVYTARLPMLRPGLWEVRVTATKDGDRFVEALAHDLLQGAPND